jgi:phage shock protein C
MRTFRLNKRDGLFFGVCAGLADYLGVEVTLVRLGAVVATLLGAFPWTFIAYGVAAWLARPQEVAARGRTGSPERSGDAGRDIERRLAELERSAASGNNSLAREIDALRGQPQGR